MACVLTTPRRLTALIATTALVLAGCGSSDDDGGDEAKTSATTVENCGLDVEVDGPPERVYAAYQPAIEVAHALGLGDTLVGTAFLDSQVLPEYTDAQKEAPYVNKLPSREGMLKEKPDFVLSGFNGVFAESGQEASFGTRGDLAELGVQSWILSPLCPSEDGLTDEAIDPATVNVETIHDDLRDLGEIFDAEDEAEEVIADQKERIAAVEKAVKGKDRPTVAIVSLREDGSFGVASGIDFGTQIIEHAGGTNAFEDLDEKRNVDVEVEQLIKTDPDVILVETCCDQDLTRDDAKGDVRTLLEKPALEGLTAVQEKEVHPFLFADRSAGVRAAHSIELVASILHPDEFSD